MSHHAYYIEGPMSLFLRYKEALQPFWAKEFEKFGIDEARALIELSSLKNIGATVFFIATASITSEAQQALLKLFEEPQRGTTFILLIPHGALMGTLRSRMLAYPHERRHHGGQNSLVEAKPTRGLFGSHGAEAFLKVSSKERSEKIATLLKGEEGGKERAREFLNALEAELYKHVHKKPEVRQGLEDIAKARSYLGDRSPSLKMLLEHLATSLPKL